MSKEGKGPGEAEVLTIDSLRKPTEPKIAPITEEEETPTPIIDEQEEDETPPTPVIEEQEEEEPEVEHRPEELKLILKSLYGEDLAIVEEDENGEEVTVPIDQAVVTPEVFQAIVEHKTKEKLSAAKEGMVSTKELDDDAKELLELSKAGVDIREMLRVQVEISDQVNSLDLDTPEGQQSAIVMYKGLLKWNRDDINSYLRGLPKERWKEVAEEAKAEILAVVDKFKEQEKQNALQIKETKAAEKKEFKKNLSKVIDEKFQIKDSFKRRLLEVATKELEDGSTELDTIYQQLLSNPEEAAEFILFAYNKEEYIKQVSSKEVLQQKLESVNKIKLSKVTPSSNPISKESRKEHRDREVIPLENLIKTQ